MGFPQRVHPELIITKIEQFVSTGTGESVDIQHRLKHGTKY